MQNQKLLVISSGYPSSDGEYLAHTFVQGYAEEAKHIFKEVFVIVLMPYKPFFIRSLMKKNQKSIFNYKFQNISILYEKYPYIPIWPFTKFRGNIAFKFLGKKVSRIVDDDTVIHANFTSPAGVFAYLFDKKFRHDFILTVHEDHNWLKKEVHCNNESYINTWQAAKALIRVNNLDNLLLKKFNDKVYAIPNGFNHRFFKPMEKNKCRKIINVPLGKQVILNIGFYNAQKNQKLLIEAISLLPNEIKDNLICFMVGGGPKHNDLINEAVDKGVNTIIKLVGQIKHETLPYYYNASDIFCLSSNSEGNPTVMFEALGTGLPYIGTNVGGVPEIITSSKYGLLCEPNKAQDLSKIIEKGLQVNWNKQVILEYAKQYSWKEIFKNTKRLYY